MPRPSIPLGTRHLIGPMVTSSRVGTGEAPGWLPCGKVDGLCGPGRDRHRWLWANTMELIWRGA